ncbi:hypothetical protein RI129_006927 [Pyrocoelia pectoralis]|uniref:THAP-type domain-containing protein n=1 Tax=Pyrocoelia pectoralis TaxID=417401 RepID=A0AAN7ZGN4_9COLE
MVCCLVVGCGSTSVRDNNLRNVCYVLSQRRNRWIAAIKREDLTETKINCGRVCSKHFITDQKHDYIISLENEISITVSKIHKIKIIKFVFE